MPELDRRTLYMALARFAGAYLLLSVAFGWAGDSYARAMLPVLEKSIEMSQSEMVLRSMSVENHQLKLEAKLAPRISDSSTLHGKQSKLKFGVSARTLFVCPILVFSLILAWPRRSAGAKATALLLAVPWIALITFLDTPHAFLAVLAKYLAGGQPVQQAFFAFVMENGGVQVLSILAAYTATRGVDGLRSQAWLLRDVGTHETRAPARNSSGTVPVTKRAAPAVSRAHKGRRRR